MRNVVMIVAVCIGTFCSLANAELAAYMTIEGATQGVIPGSCILQAHPGDITVYGYEHTVTTLPNPETCQATGHPNHSPLVVIKYVDKATVPLFAAFNNNELLRNVTLRCWRTTTASPYQEQQYTVTLLNARIAGIRHEMLYMGSGATQQAVPQLERISFTYERITETWNQDGGIEEAADWRRNAKSRMRTAI